MILSASLSCSAAAALSVLDAAALISSSVLGFLYWPKFDPESDSHSCCAPPNGNGDCTQANTMMSYSPAVSVVPRSSVGSTVIPIPSCCMYCANSSDWLCRIALPTV